MEQKILLFTNRKNSTALAEAQNKSQELAEEGWFVHDTCATGYWHHKWNLARAEVMVTYRRKG